MAELPPGYRDIPEEDRKKAQVFFDRGKTVADSLQFEYAIEMYLQGLSLDPDATEAHQALREISMRRKASGGKAMGFMERGRLKKGDDKQNMLNAEKLLAYDPGNMDHMTAMMTSAQKGGFYDTVMWIGPILFRANSDQKKPEFSRYITLKDMYKAVGRYTAAVEACQAAVRLRPDDMDLAQEAKNLAANETISKGKYDQGGNFRDSVRNREEQDKLLESERDYQSEDALTRAVRDAEEVYATDPNDPSKLTKLIDALVKTEQPDFENRAIEVLDQQFAATKQYKHRQRIGQIKMAQLSRLERSLRQAVEANKDDAAAKKDYNAFLKDKWAEELHIFSETVENYPTDTTARFEMGRRLFLLSRFEDAIPVFQQVRNDPKYKVPAGVSLGRSFLEAGFPDEAADTLAVVIGEYPARGDDKSKEMTYWYARALEEKKDVAGALKNYSQVFQWDAKYRDVQARIKNLRSGGGTPGGTPPAPVNV